MSKDLDDDDYFVNKSDYEEDDNNEDVENNFNNDDYYESAEDLEPKSSQIDKIRQIKLDKMKYKNIPDDLESVD